MKGVCPVRCSCANRLCVSFQDSQTALQQLEVPLQVSEQDVQVNRTHSKAAPASYSLPLGSKRNSLQDAITFACLSSSSASSTRFFLNAATRLVLKSMSSEDGKTDQSDPVARTGNTRRDQRKPNGSLTASPCLADSEIFSNLWQQSCWVVSACRTSLFLARALSRALLAFS